MTESNEIYVSSKSVGQKNKGKSLTKRGVLTIRRSYLKKRGGLLNCSKKQSNQMKIKNSIPCRKLPEHITPNKTMTGAVEIEIESAASLHRQGEMRKV